MVWRNGNRPVRLSVVCWCLIVQDETVGVMKGGGR